MLIFTLAYGDQSRLRPYCDTFIICMYEMLCMMLHEYVILDV